MRWKLPEYAGGLSWLMASSTKIQVVKLNKVKITCLCFRIVLAHVILNEDPGVQAEWGENYLSMLEDSLGTCHPQLRSSWSIWMRWKLPEYAGGLSWHMSSSIEIQLVKLNEMKITRVCCTFPGTCILNRDSGGQADWSGNYQSMLEDFPGKCHPQLRSRWLSWLRWKLPEYAGGLSWPMSSSTEIQVVKMNAVKITWVCWRIVLAHVILYQDVVSSAWT